MFIFTRTFFLCPRFFDEPVRSYEFAEQPRDEEEGPLTKNEPTASAGEHEAMQPVATEDVVVLFDALSLNIDSQFSLAG